MAELPRKTSKFSYFLLVKDIMEKLHRLNKITPIVLKKALAAFVAGVFLFNTVFSWAQEERLFSAGMENKAFSSSPAINGKLSAKLRTTLRGFKERYKAAAICRFIEKNANLEDLGSVVKRWTEVISNFDNVTIIPKSTPDGELAEIIIEIPEEGMAVRYFDPTKANVITPYTDVSKLTTKIISPRLNRQIIHRIKALEATGATENVQKLGKIESEIKDAIENHPLIPLTFTDGRKMMAKIGLKDFGSYLTVYPHEYKVETFPELHDSNSDIAGSKDPQLPPKGSFGQIVWGLETINEELSLIFYELQSSQWVRNLPDETRKPLVSAWVPLAVETMMNLVRDLGIKQFYASTERRIKDKWPDIGLGNLDEHYNMALQVVGKWKEEKVIARNQFITKPYELTLQHYVGNNRAAKEDLTKTGLDSDAQAVQSEVKEAHEDKTKLSPQELLSKISGETTNPNFHNQEKWSYLTHHGITKHENKMKAILNDIECASKEILCTYWNHNRRPRPWGPIGFILDVSEQSEILYAGLVHIGSDIIQPLTCSADEVESLKKKLRSKRKPVALEKLHKLTSAPLEVDLTGGGIRGIFIQPQHALYNKHYLTDIIQSTPLVMAIAVKYNLPIVLLQNTSKVAGKSRENYPDLRRLFNDLLNTYREYFDRKLKDLGFNPQDIWPKVDQLIRDGRTDKWTKLVKGGLISHEAIGPSYSVSWNSLNYFAAKVAKPNGLSLENLTKNRDVILLGGSLKEADLVRQKCPFVRKIHIVNIDSEWIESMAKDVYEKYGMEAFEKYAFYNRNIADLRDFIPDESMALAISIGTLEFNDDETAQRALHEMERILMSGGIALVNDLPDWRRDLKSFLSGEASLLTSNDDIPYLFSLIFAFRMQRGTLPPSEKVADTNTHSSIGKSYIDYIDKNETLIKNIPPAEGPAALVRVPVEILDFMDVNNISNFLETFQKPDNRYVELYYMSGMGEVSEEIYQKYGLKKKTLPKGFKRTRQNTITLFPAFKGEELDHAALRSRLGSLDLTPEDTILSPIGIRYDSLGLIRGTILGLIMMQIARDINESPDLLKDTGKYIQLKDRVQKELLEQSKNIWDPNTEFKFTPEDIENIIGLIAGDKNSILPALNKLIKLLPITPIDVEELRQIFKHAADKFA